MSEQQWLTPQSSLDWPELQSAISRLELQQQTEDLPTEAVATVLGAVVAMSGLLLQKLLEEE